MALMAFVMGKRDTKSVEDWVLTIVGLLAIVFDWFALMFLR